MKRLNNKGFLITGTVYALLVLFIVLIMGILTVFITRNRLMLSVVDNIKAELDSKSATEFRHLTSSGTYNNWKSISTLSKTDYERSIDSIPSIGYLDGYYQLNTNNVSMNVKNNKGYLNFNGTNSFASSAASVSLNGTTNYIKTNQEVNLDATNQAVFNLEFTPLSNGSGVIAETAPSLTSTTPGVMIEYRSGQIYVTTKGPTATNTITYYTMTNAIKQNKLNKLKVTVDTTKNNKNEVITITVNGQKQALGDGTASGMTYVSGYKLGRGINCFGSHASTSQFLAINFNRINLYADLSETKLIYKYEFTSETGADLIDYSGNSYNGIINGTFTKKEQRFVAAYPTGSTGATTSASFNTLPNWSYRVSFSVPPTDGNERIIIGTNNASQAGAALVIQNGKLGYANNGTKVIDGTTILTPNSVYTATVTYSNGITKLFLNNALEGEANFQLTDSAVGTTIGNTGIPTAESALNNGLWDITVWERTLTIEEITEMNQAGVGSKGKDMLARYKLANNNDYLSVGTPSTIDDLSGNGNNLTNTIPMATLSNWANSIYLELDASECNGTIFSTDNTSLNLDSSCKLNLTTESSITSITDYVYNKNDHIRLLLVFDKTTSKYNAFINGATYTTTLSSPSTPLVFTDLTLGKNVNATSFFKGNIYNLIVSTNLLPDDQAKQVTSGGTHHSQIFTYEFSPLMIEPLNVR